MQRTHDPQALLEGGKQFGKHAAPHISQLRTVKDTLQQTFHDLERLFACLDAILRKGECGTNISRLRTVACLPRHYLAKGGCGAVAF